MYVRHVDPALQKPLRLGTVLYTINPPNLNANILKVPNHKSTQMKKEIREIDTTMLKYEDMGKINANKCQTSFT